MQIIFSLSSFEISKGILRNHKFIIGLDSFSNQFSIYLAHLDNTSLCICNGYPAERYKNTIILFGSMLPLKVTDYTRVAETAVWPIPFLIKILSALKGFQFNFYLEWEVYGASSLATTLFPAVRYIFPYLPHWLTNLEPESHSYTHMTGILLTGTLNLMQITQFRQLVSF